MKKRSIVNTHNQMASDLAPSLNISSGGLKQTLNPFYQTSLFVCGKYCLQILEKFRPRVNEGRLKLLPSL